MSRTESPSWLSESLNHVEAARRVQVYFIVGCQKSGTTWLQILLNASGVTPCRGEGHYSDVFVPLLQRAISTYNAQDKASIKADTGELLAMARLFCDGRFGKAVLSAEHPPAVVATGDKTPEGAYGMPLLNQLYPDAKFIHIVRDGRDACVSGWAHLNRLGNGAKFPSITEYASYFASGHWRPYITNARATGSALGEDRYIEVRYEALLENPSEHAWRLLQFLGAEPDEQMVNRAVGAASFKQLSGREPGEADNSSHFRRGISGSWISELPEPAVAAFEAQAGSLLESLGYPLSTAITPTAP